MPKIVADILDMLLAKDTREGIGCDNMTAILITLKPYPWWNLYLFVEIFTYFFLLWIRSSFYDDKNLNSINKMDL